MGRKAFSFFIRHFVLFPTKDPKFSTWFSFGYVLILFCSKIRKNLLKKKITKNLRKGSRLTCRRQYQVKNENSSMELYGFLVSKETVVLRRWERSKQKFGFIKRVDKG